MSIRHSAIQRWSSVRYGEELAKQLAKDPKVPPLFCGATSLVRFSETLAGFAVSQDKSLTENPVDDDILMQVLAMSFQGAIVKGIKGKSLHQLEILLISIAHHYAEKQLSNRVQPLQQIVLKLHAQWKTNQIAVRESNRSIGKPLSFK